jgi:hypothetical protein
MVADALHTTDCTQSSPDQRTNFIISVSPEGQTESVKISIGDFHHD